MPIDYEAIREREKARTRQIAEELLRDAGIDIEPEQPDPDTPDWGNMFIDRELARLSRQR